MFHQLCKTIAFYFDYNISVISSDDSSKTAVGQCVHLEDDLFFTCVLILPIKVSPDLNKDNYTLFIAAHSLYTRDKPPKKGNNDTD